MEQMVPHLLLHQDADVVFGQMISLTREQASEAGTLMQVQWAAVALARIPPGKHAFPTPPLLPAGIILTGSAGFDETFRIAMDYELFLRAQGGLRAQFVPLTLVGMRAGGLCVNNIVDTLREAKRAQIKNQALPKWIAEINFLLRVGRRLFRQDGASGPGSFCLKN